MPRRQTRDPVRSRPDIVHTPDAGFGRSLHGALACLTVGLTVFAVASPDAFREAMQEDALAEWATFWLFACGGGFAWAGVAGLGRGSAAPALSRSGPVILAGLGLFCLFVAGEEISWGQRFFGFRPPDVFLEHNYQQELNLHNLVMEFVKTRLLVAAIALGYGVVLPLLARFVSTNARPPWSWVRMAAPQTGLAPWFLLVAVVELLYPVSYTGEAAELTLGAVFLADVWIRVRPAGPLTSPVAVLAACLAVLVLARTSIVVGAIAAAAGDDILVARAEADLDRLSDDLALGDAIRSSLLQAGGVHQRVFTAVQKGHLRVPPAGRYLGSGQVTSDDEPAASVRNRRTYFLDPWHNSYWLYSNRRAGYILLYSMGPNRKRDTPVATLIPPELRDADMSGDDIGIAIELGPGR